MVLTKAYRCNAKCTDRKARTNPFEPLTGTTEFSETIFPLFFETDKLAEMEAFVAANGVIVMEEAG